MNKTFQNVIDTFEYWTLSGNSITQGFGYGELWEVNPEILNYPAIWIDNVTNNHTYQAGNVIFNLDIWIFDLVYSDKSNGLYVLSDSVQIGLDLINEFRDNEDTYGFFINKNLGVNIPFIMYNEMWDDSVSGVKFTVQIVIEDDGNICENISGS